LSSARSPAGDAVNYTLSTTATQFSGVAGSPYAIAVNLGANANYNVTPVDGAMTIDAALATVTANNKTKTYGDVNPALDAVVVGEIAGGDVVNYTLSTAATQFSGVRGQPLRDRGQPRRERELQRHDGRRRDDDRRGTGHGNCQQQGQDLR
jgi:hypothetical protein